MFQNKTRCPHIQHFLCIQSIVVHRQENHLGIKPFFANLPDRINSIQGRHADVRNYNIRFEMQGFLNKRLSVFNHPDHIIIRF